MELPNIFGDFRPNLYFLPHFWTKIKAFLSKSTLFTPLLDENAGPTGKQAALTVQSSGCRSPNRSRPN